MRTVAMCFSILQVPRCEAASNSWFKIFNNFINVSRNSSNFRVLGSRASGFEGGHSRKWIRRPINTKPEGGKKNTLISKTSNLSKEISDGSMTTNTELLLNIKKSGISDLQSIRYCDIQQKTGDPRDSSLVTVFVFDIETTGFHRKNDRIIELGVQDLGGGENSTFQTLINPERHVPNPHVHGISTHMVNRRGVPSMKDLIPILLQYVESRQKPGGRVLLVSHNGRSFDVPFLCNEFRRCSFEIPPNWIFLDTLPLAREVMKSAGSKQASLQALREHFEIPLVGPAHRAMADVRVLSLVLQRLTFDLKLSVSDLTERSFSVSDLTSAEKKKN